MSKKLLLAFVLVALIAFGAGTQFGFSPEKSMISARINYERFKAKARRAISGNAPVARQAETDQPDYSETSTVGKYRVEQVFHSDYLDADLIVPPGVFMPGEAEFKVLPLMSRHKDLFKGKVVMEIGAGSGPISLYAAKNGATKVVATDISPDAIAAIKQNAQRLGVADILEARLVPLDDMGAYSVIGEDEKFDLIISNPPYALDLDAPTNTAATDTGELGFSIVRGFNQHLQPDGIALLFYDSLFYHQVMKKFSRYENFSVISHNPIGMYTWAAETLFNSYLERLLEKENMDPQAFRFVRDTDGLHWAFLRNQGLDVSQLKYKPLITGSGDDKYYPGWLAIRHAQAGQEAG